MHLNNFSRGLGTCPHGWLRSAAIRVVVVFLSTLLSACLPVSSRSAPTAEFDLGSSTPLQTVSSLGTQPVGTATPHPTASPLPSLTPTVSPTPSPSATPDPYKAYSLEHLSQRTYGGGELVVEEVLATNSYFTRTLISYPSDGLRIYGFMNVPQRGSPPFPVVIALHGYIEPEIYETVDYTTRYADALARNGFLVLHPNLRGYPPSDEGDNLFRVGMAIDVLNLIALVRDQGGEPGPLAEADPEAIGVWGHSMGGGISTRVITVDQGVRAAVLYGAMSGDEQKNFERILNYFSNGQRGHEELSAPPEAFQRISPINHLDRIQAAVSVHHGGSDSEVPLAWSLDLCDRLQGMGKVVECFTYPGQPHTFFGDDDLLFMQRMVDFFNRWLRNP